MKPIDEKKIIDAAKDIGENILDKDDPKPMSIESLKEVTGGGAFDDFPRVNDNDYDEGIKERI